MNDDIKEYLQKKINKLEIKASRAVSEMTFAPLANIEINGLSLELLEDIKHLGAGQMLFDYIYNQLNT